MPNFGGFLAGLAGLPAGYQQAQQQQNQLAYQQILAAMARKQLQDAIAAKQAQGAAGAYLSGPNAIPGFPTSTPSGGFFGSQTPSMPTPGPSPGPEPQPSPAAAPASPALPPAAPAGASAAPPATAPAAAQPEPQAGPGAAGDDPRVAQIFRQMNPQEVARGIKQAKPDLPDEQVLQATQMIMQMGAAGNKMEQAYALALLREAGLTQRHETPSGSAIVGATSRENVAGAQIGSREREGAANRASREKIAAENRASMDARAAQRNALAKSTASQAQRTRTLAAQLASNDRETAARLAADPNADVSDLHAEREEIIKAMTPGGGVVRPNRMPTNIPPGGAGAPLPPLQPQPPM